MAQETSPTTNPLAKPPGTSGRGSSSFEQDVGNIYEELRRLGANLKTTERDVTLTTSQMVRDVCLRTEGWPGMNPLEPQVYRRAAARAMRMLLVKAARNQSRPGSTTRQVIQLTLGAEVSMGSGSPPDLTKSHVLLLDSALNELHLLDSYQADLLEMKYFGGFSVAETAENLQLPEPKVSRDLRVAEAWLKIRLMRR